MPIELDNGAVLVQTQDQILAELNQAFSDTFGGDFDLSDASFTYRQNAIWANREAALQSLIAATITSQDIERATGRQLDYIGSLLAAPRKGPTRSTIPATLYGNPGTNVGDRRVRYVLTGDLWRTPIGATIGDDGTVAVTLTSDDTGPIFATAQASTGWVIVDVLTGWARLETTADAERGRTREEDPEYRARLLLARSAVAGTEPAVRAAIAGIDGVTAYSYENNRSPVISASGVLPWHAEAVITGGTDQAIADTLYATYGDTTGFFGNTSFTVYDPTDNTPTVVKWSRITNYQVQADLVLQLAGDTPLPEGAADTIIAAVANRINTNGAGIDVDPGDLLAVAALSLPPGCVEPDDSTCEVAFKGGTFQTTPLVITHRENAFTSTLPSPATVTGTQVAPFDLTDGTSLVMEINDGPSFFLTVNVADYAVISAATITEVVEAFASQAPDGLIVGSSGGALTFTTEDTGEDASVSIGLSSSLALLAALGFSVGTSTGTEPDITIAFTGP